MQHDAVPGTVAEWCTLLNSASSWSQLLAHFHNFHSVARTFKEHQQINKLFLERGKILCIEFLHSPEGQAEEEKRREMHRQKQVEAIERMGKHLGRTSFVAAARIEHRAFK